MSATNAVRTLRESDWGLRYQPEFFASVCPEPSWLDPSRPQLQAQPVRAGGRQAAWYIQLPSGQAAVLRQYRRGGLVARFLHDQYLWLGAERSRSWAEFAVMVYLAECGVAVPEPVAALWQRKGVYYRASLITQKIEAAQPLAQELLNSQIEPVARAIKQMHDAGVDHADLNALNILLDQQGRVWLIDFDRARRYARLSYNQRKRNLSRLQRSLLKLCGPSGGQWYQQLVLAYRSLLV